MAQSSMLTLTMPLHFQKTSTRFVTIRSENTSVSPHRNNASISALTTLQFVSAAVAQRLRLSRREPPFCCAVWIELVVEPDAVHRHTQGVDGRRVVLEARDAKGGGGDADMVVIDESVNR